MLGLGYLGGSQGAAESWAHHLGLNQQVCLCVRVHVILLHHAMWRQTILEASHLALLPADGCRTATAAGPLSASRAHTLESRGVIRPHDKPFFIISILSTCYFDWRVLLVQVSASAAGRWCFCTTIFVGVCPPAVIHALQTRVLQICHPACSPLAFHPPFLLSPRCHATRPSCQRAAG